MKKSELKSLIRQELNKLKESEDINVDSIAKQAYSQTMSQLMKFGIKTDLKVSDFVNAYDKQPKEFNVKNNISALLKQFPFSLMYKQFEIKKGYLNFESTKAGWYIRLTFILNWKHYSGSNGLRPTMIKYSDENTWEINN